MSGKLYEYYSPGALSIKPQPGEQILNTTRPSLTLLLCLSFVIAAGLACGSTDAPDDVAPVANAPATSPNSAAPAAPSQAAASDIGGDYAVTGTNPNGTNYNGNLTVTKRDEVYQFSWTSGDREYDGVGVRTDNTVAVSFTQGADGKGCGVVLYKVGADGSLDGRSGYWGVNTSETEKAVRTSGGGLRGTYDVTGKNPNGADYKGKLAVNKQGAGFSFQWDIGGTPFTGFGIQSGDKAAVGFGGQQCGFVSYEINADGSLEGKWGGQGSTVTGTEVARKR